MPKEGRCGYAVPFSKKTGKGTYLEMDIDIEKKEKRQFQGMSSRLRASQFGGGKVLEVG